MLRGNAGERRSRWDVGDEVRGCSLQPGPDSSYLDGAEMRGIWRDYDWSNGIIWVSKFGLLFVMRQWFAWMMVPCRA